MYSDIENPMVQGDYYDDDDYGPDSDAECCLHGIPWCEECEQCNEAEDEADGL
jgi:hypothetical protein